MKVKIAVDEWYPCYSLAEDWGTEAEVDDATVERWQRVMREFDAIQREMGKLVP